MKNFIKTLILASFLTVLGTNNVSATSYKVKENTLKSKKSIDPVNIFTVSLCFVLAISAYRFRKKII